MKKMHLHKGLAFLLIGLMLITLTACGGSSNAPAPAASETPAASDAPAEAPASDEVFELKFAHVVRPTTPKGAAADEFKRLLEERSNGRITVTVFPDSQMGTDQEINEQILTGTLDINAPFFSTVTSFVSEFELFDLPYLFTSEEQIFNALHGEVGAKFNEYLQEKGLVGLGYWSGGFKQLTNNVRPVKSVEDLDGLKIRVSQSPLLVSQFRAINAGGISVPFSELYSALQTGTVDGQENPYSNIASRKFYEVQDYMTISDHGFMGYALIMSKAKYDAMPADLQALLQEVSNEVAAWQWEQTAAMDSEYLQEIIDAGMIVDEFGPAEKEAYRAATAVVYDEFAAKENGQELLDLVEQYTR
ncbi:TRAP transporter substrate-binding protein [Anoxynatronum buryatiense]|uniref:C4-dicarboxylate-binding protein DctP n=1 Tax=Anoxynatronum buryatiense TaxID=489973 RepID=A0AA45WVB0_9CLOT|nr:TRAP transporter substrate-binding protein [Anoxynatronum buryatiense]SMP51186.1 C4-dicarboxylate-binding protein DctP [Anoxynatronum buryatiense]